MPLAFLLNGELGAGELELLTEFRMLFEEGGARAFIGGNDFPLAVFFAEVLLGGGASSGDFLLVNFHRFFQLAINRRVYDSIVTLFLHAAHLEFLNHQKFVQAFEAETELLAADLLLQLSGQQVVKFVVLLRLEQCEKLLDGCTGGALACVALRGTIHRKQQQQKRAEQDAFVTMHKISQERV